MAAAASYLPLHAAAQDLPLPSNDVFAAPPPVAPAVPDMHQPGPPLAQPLPTQIVDMPRASAELEVIHRRSQLIIARNRIVRTAIADPSIIDLIQFDSPAGNEISVIGMATGSTTLTVWFENDPVPLIYNVHCIRDPSLDDQRRLEYGRLEQKLAALFPNSKVYLIPVSGKIVVKGQARDPEEASRILEIVRGEVINQLGMLGGPQPAPVVDPALGNPLTPFDLASSYIVNMLEVPGEYQVMLRVRIAEINRTQLRELGVNLSALFDNGSQFVSSAAGGFPGTLTGIFEDGEIAVLVNWMAGNGTAKILSEPTLTVLSGHPASFLSGQEFPVPTIVGVQGVGAQQTTFRGAGTSLVVTPTVVDKDLIRLQIVPEFSQINAGIGNNGVSGLDVRRVQTTVELREGQTMAIAGLIHHQDNTTVSRIPWLGDCPWIGPLLFSAKQSGQAESELLILVTPEIVRPMDAEEVPPLPGFEATVPDDCLLYDHNRTEGMPDLQPYQVAPLGTGGGYGIPVPYTLYNPAPAEPLYSPIPTNPYGSEAPPQPLMVSPGGYGPQGYPQPQAQPVYPRTPPAAPPAEYTTPPPAPAPSYRPPQPATGAGWSTIPGTGAARHDRSIQQMSGMSSAFDRSGAEESRRKLRRFGQGLDGSNRY